ncbi:MAG: chitobiase/beta-hexosaminidase C-terminal domain-containing protein [Candidatus Methylacidiphilales bacterium]|nr:chitobiase/beta-hexosaminidase C-terminal domain-containing protein [Candidatus Methylacidiphilales bacterium]
MHTKPAALILTTLLGLSALTCAISAAEGYYREPSWKPRAILPAADALRGDFWPAPPKVEVDYLDPAFADDRLSSVPPPGVHPRVLLSPADVDRIRAKVALGEKAPAAFRVMWARVSESRSAFYALVAKDDVLGRKLAADLVRKIKTLEPKLDKIDAQPDRDNLWCVERSLTASGDPDPPTEIWALLDYDYLHGWMTPEERESARRVIARLTRGRISNFMTYPEHFMINNHQGFGMEYIRLLLLIEGEKGYDPAVFKLAVRKCRAMLNWYLNKDGMCYESIKGWLNISAFVAVGRRERDFLKHSHLRAKMNFFQQAIRWVDGRWQIRDEMRASAFHVIWMMRYFHPGDLGYDWLYRATFSSHDFLTDPKAKWPNPVGISPDLLLLFAEEGMLDKQGRPLDWNDQARIDALKLPLTWKDDTRGYLLAKNSSRIDDLKLGFVCKQDFFYGGHEGSETNRLTLWAHGVNWVRDVDMLAVKATGLQNMLTIDGKGLAWPPCPGVWLGVQDSPLGVTAAGDGKIAYSHSKVMQVHPLDFPSAKIPYYAPFAEGNYDLTRDLQVAFHPGTVQWDDGYAHTDYGPWSGETRLVEHYKSNNPVEQAYRTVHLARGARPYVLVLDDARKDGKSHLYEWNISVPDGARLVEAKIPEVQFQNVDPSEKRQSDLILGLEGTPRDPKSGRLTPAKGDPLLLVRVLWRNSPYGYPVPRLENTPVEVHYPYKGSARLTIPAISESPEFRVMLYPFRQGDPLPVTEWNRDRSELSVVIGDQKDTYRFAQADGGRTVFAMQREGKSGGEIPTRATPARPVLDVRGVRTDVNEARTTRAEGEVPEYRFDGMIQAGWVRPPAPAYVVYTLDGTPPHAKSPRYQTPLEIKKTTEVQARIVDPAWPGGQSMGAVLKARFIQVPAAAGISQPPAGSQSGLQVRVYEKKTVMWDDRGFFRANKVMLPDLDRETPVSTSLAPGFQLPHTVPLAATDKQVKGFYRFTGWFRADAPGAHEFAVDSCGPVRLQVAGQTVMASTGVYHQQQAVRRGTAVLGTGWHPLELIVCDPLYWNLATADLMPFRVTVRHESGPDQAIDHSRLATSPLSAAAPFAPAVVWKEARPAPGWMEPGVVLSIFERENKNHDPDYLDIEGLPPLRQEKTEVLEANLRPALVRVYDGWFHAPADGIYAFDLPSRRGASAGLGELRAAYQNQLRIDGEVVVQRGIPGRFPLRRIGLKAGWHEVSLRLGSSPAAGSVTYPDGQTLPLTAAELSRPLTVDIRPKDAARADSVVEIFRPTPVVLSLPAGREGQIRYTLDGRDPGPDATLYRGPVTVAGNATLTAAAYVQGRAQAATPPARVAFSLVDRPLRDRIGHVDFAGWNGEQGPMANAQPCAVWVAPEGKPGSGPGSVGRVLLANPQPAKATGEAGQIVDINLTKGLGNSAFKLTGLRMRDNAITVGVWFRSPSADGKLFGKDGLTAFGKSYKTVSCALSRGHIQVGPGKFSGGKVAPGEWTHVVLASDADAQILYINGEKVAAGPGSPSLATDALDFFTDHTAEVASASVYGRVLGPDEIRQWYVKVSATPEIPGKATPRKTP